MPRSVAFLLIASGVVLWIVAVIVALEIDTERLTDWLMERSQVIDPVMAGSIAAGSAVAFPCSTRNR